MRFYRTNGVWTDGAGNALKTSPVQCPLSGTVSIPRPIAEEAHKAYDALYGNGQTLERLEERGGFEWAEMAELLYERIKMLESGAKR